MRLRGWLITFLLGVVLGGSGGVALGFFLFPYVFQPPAATERLSEAEVEQPVLARGEFIHANPSDPIHYGSGRVTVRQGSVFLEENFKVGPGPAYHVYLVPRGSIRSSRDVHGAMYVDLGRLRAFEGSQRFDIPEGVDLMKYPSVVIWCERFQVLISPADLVYGDGENDAAPQETSPGNL